MSKQFLLENPRDAGDDRVTFVIRNNGTVLPGFVSRATLIAIGGLTSNNIVALYTEHRARIAEAVRKKMAQPGMRQYISLGLTDLQ
ncbi:DUF1488 family protein [Herbaspirillum sp. RV1423]|uniref:DUF1488 family protein n=1 Tax=Herbaspirillum sp. RV1423 TaxID=1443993 RepID=UPI0004B8BEAF|nr:DUF1488 family protein [Herbaspirillum sp. RV1423]